MTVVLATGYGPNYSFFDRQTATMYATPPPPPLQNYVHD